MIKEILEEASRKMEAYLATLPKVNAVKIGLDRRACYGDHIWVSDDEIIMYETSAHSMNYYGGFEYVDSEHITKFNEFVIYSSEDDRIKDCIEFYRGETEGN